MDISSVKSKMGIATRYFEVTVTLTKKNFMDIPNVVVEGCHPLCWSCGAVGHLSKSCPGKRPTPQPQLPKSREGTGTITKSPKGGLSEWTDVTKKGSKTAASPHSRMFHIKRRQRSWPHPQKSSNKSTSRSFQGPQQDYFYHLAINHSTVFCKLQRILF